MASLSHLKHTGPSAFQSQIDHGVGMNRPSHTGHWAVSTPSSRALMCSSRVFKFHGLPRKIAFSIVKDCLSLMFGPTHVGIRQNGSTPLSSPHARDYAFGLCLASGMTPHFSPQNGHFHPCGGRSYPRCMWNEYGIPVLSHKPIEKWGKPEPKCGLTDCGILVKKGYLHGHLPDSDAT